MGHSLGIGRALRAPSQQEIERKPGEENTHSDTCIARIFINRIDHNQSRDGSEKSSGPGMAWDAIADIRSSAGGGIAAVASAKDEQRCRCETEEKPIHYDHVAKDLLIRSKEEDSDRNATLEHDRSHRSAAPPGEPRESGGEQAI